ncbi:unnamed protein product [Ambrosiozyma monospora]|uniref:Unnamed protein product n=1 Tax=Ambrosiozyma monospora TaxID=43982 RepID=A0A9W6YSR2_AMBMO|nr:unnamed protein product [Ambrosiozyma monospora]
MTDRRYEDPVLIKSDGLPTYHFANVVDDHLMEITHVIRGEEWLASTPKHIALYNAFGWTPPKFIHIPLLTTINNKKLSKRSGDIDIMSLKSKGYLGEALINFSVLFGWSPKRELGEKYNEFHELKDLEKNFPLEGLTIGNAKVDFKKLDFFNKHYLGVKLINDEAFLQQCVEDVYPSLLERLNVDSIDKSYLGKVVKNVGPTLTNIKEFDNEGQFDFLFKDPNYQVEHLKQFTKVSDVSLFKAILEELSKANDLHNLEPIVKSLVEKHNIKKKLVYQLLRFSVTGSQSGIKLPIMVDLLTQETVFKRIDNLKSQL